MYMLLFFLAASEVLILSQLSQLSGWSNHPSISIIWVVKPNPLIRMHACSVTKSCLTPWTVAHQAPLSWDFPGKNTGAGCHFLLQGIFLTQGSNQHLLHCRRSLPLGHLEAPELPTSMLNTSHSFHPPHQGLMECLHFTKALLSIRVSTSLSSLLII